MKFGKRWQVLVSSSALVLAACAEQPLGVDSARPQFNVVGEPVEAPVPDSQHDSHLHEAYGWGV